MEFRTSFDRKRVSSDCGGESRTKPSFAAECEINNILAKYNRTGLLDHANRYQGQYGDFCVNTDYHAACNAVIEAQDMFMSMPAKIRSKFDNDPGQFLEFAQDPNNAEALIDLGLATRVSASPEPSESPVLTDENET